MLVTKTNLLHLQTGQHDNLRCHINLQMYTLHTPTATSLVPQQSTLSTASTAPPNKKRLLYTPHVKKPQHNDFPQYIQTLTHPRYSPHSHHLPRPLHTQHSALKKIFLLVLSTFHSSYHCKRKFRQKTPETASFDLFPEIFPVNMICLVKWKTKN